MPEPPSASELDEARRATEGFCGGPGFSVADVHQLRRDANAVASMGDLRDLLGLSDRCADIRATGASADGLGIPRARPEQSELNLHEAVDQMVLDALETHWTTFGQDPRNWTDDADAMTAAADVALRRLLAAVLHRVSWALSQSDLPLTHRATDLTRVAQWMEVHPHALLSLRCSGLVYSKQNRYVPAWLTFAELRLRLSHYESSYRSRSTEGRVVTVEQHVIDMFREVQQQALLAETGTAARTVERMLVDWIDQTDGKPERWKRLRYHEAFNTLRRGTLTGGMSSDEVETMPTQIRKSVERAAVPSWKRRPGVMTARCHLELATLALVIDDIGIKAAPGDVQNWQQYADSQLDAFAVHYEKAHADASVAFDAEHVRELVQLRLHAALINPAWELEPVKNRDAPPCLRTTSPTRRALAGWLKRNGDNANVVLSISAPEFLAQMQTMSGDSTLLDWIAHTRRDALRRDASQRTKPDGTRYRVGNDADRDRVVRGVSRAKEILRLRQSATAG